MSGSSRFIVRPGRCIGGVAAVPGDKSISHRALMLGAIADGLTEVNGFLASEDCLATLAALRAMGADIDEQASDRLRISGRGLQGLHLPAGPLDLGNSGTALRLLIGLMAGQGFSTELTGDQSLHRRPMDRIAEPLREMGAGVETTDGNPPVYIKGKAKLSGIDYLLPVASAQVKSAVLLAALYAQGQTRITEPVATRDHTERMLPTFGVPVTRDKRTAAICGPAQPIGARIDVPGDLSSAAFMLAAAFLSEGDPVMINKVGINPTRTGDLAIRGLMGAEIRTENHTTMGNEPVASLIGLPSPLRGATVPPELVPLAIDEFPLIFALAGCVEGETVVTGATELRHKESDRIAVMIQGLKELGIDAEEFPDGARIVGGKLSGGTVDSHGDHRVAMAFSVAAITATAPVTILNVDNVDTSFPGFVPTMQSLGVDLHHQPAIGK